MTAEIPIYDPEVLMKYNLGERHETLKQDETLCVRPLYMSDYGRGFLELLKELTEVGNISEEQFQEQFKFMKNSHGTYYCTVIIDTIKDRVVGASTLLMERKFIRGCALRARLEDVVVSPNYRGKQLGKCIVEILTNLGRALGAYKMTLDCKDSMTPFYESLGYAKEPGNSNTLSIRYPTTSNPEPKL
ncbi:probable glucosamine 6-phosphate N-acetyltransferase [Daphnia carinata]|uniref:probable glucosamine 6-phosphate N-acetyltransferase n=1 Tax=Daphnia carinata TaxID=120202 RepID=UPI00257CF8D1|nr:probable glucosamine 6-phosphate N-acetyltransferase [Daphnia carinata]XP_059350913.1 probable glucosamine 6-phosphate N-acetyltransferase [Daphnia carinata]